MRLFPELVIDGDTGRWNLEIPLKTGRRAVAKDRALKLIDALNRGLLRHRREQRKPRRLCTGELLTGVN